MGIYVETVIRAPLEDLWRHTQTPALHERWDLRFSEIAYLPRRDGEAQRFRYATRLGVGRTIEGEGETVGRRDLPDGSRSSALRFGSASRLSLIREGRGYWKYVPTDDGIRFLTSYDYATRFGRLGAAFDRAVFRPLMGWATAWSFDRLRLWLERGIPPAHAARQALAHGLARVGLALILGFQGLVPKLLGRDPDELALLVAAGVPAHLSGAALTALGVTELGAAVILLVAWHRAWPAALLAAAAVAVTAGVAVVSPDQLGRAFGPFPVNLAVLLLAAIDLVTLRDSPSAGRCRRRPAR